MGLLKKSSGPDLVDYTMLQKKGFIKKKVEKKLPYKLDKSGALDLTQPTMDAAAASFDLTPTPAPATPASSSEEGGGSMGFLSTLAGAGPSTASASDSAEVTKELGALKIKIEDVEFKFERLIDKITQLESKLEHVERKLIS